MTKETAEKILDSQFKEVYYEFMKTNQTGSNYLKALQIVYELNTIMRNSRLDDRKDKEYIDLSIINEIYADVVKKVTCIDCTNSNDEETIVILSASVARELIKKGFVLRDIKANKFDNKKTVFVFQKTDSLLLQLKSTENIKNNKPITL